MLFRNYILAATWSFLGLTCLGCGASQSTPGASSGAGAVEDDAATEIVGDDPSLVGSVEEDSDAELEERIAQIEAQLDELEPDDARHARVLERLIDLMIELEARQQREAFRLREARHRQSVNSPAGSALRAREKNAQVEANTTGERVIELCLYFVDAHPDDAHVGRMLYLAGSMQNSLDRTDEATSTWERVLDTAPDSEFVDDAHAGLGEIHFLQADMKTAAGHFEAVIRMSSDPRLVEYARYKLGWVHLNTGAYDDAFDTFSELARGKTGELSLRREAAASAVMAYARSQYDPKAARRLLTPLAGSPAELEELLEELAIQYESDGRPQDAATVRGLRRR